jgi:hypothetical protein
MKKNILVLSSLAILAFSACSAGGSSIPDEQAAQNLKDAIVATSEQKSSSFKLMAEMSIKADNLPEEEMERINSLKVSFEVEGKGDGNEAENPKMLADMKVDVSEKEGSISAEAGFGFAEGTIYAMLKDLSVEGGFAQDFPAAIFEGFKGTWWSMELPPEVTTELSTMLQLSADPEKEAEVMALIKEVDMFKNVKHKKTVSNGEQYKAELDTDGLVQLMEKTAALYGETVNEQELAMVKEFYQGVEFDGLITVNNEGFISAFDGEMMLNATGITPEENMQMTLDLNYEISDHGKELDITMPEDAQMFDPMMLLGGMMMMDPAMMEGEVEMSTQ